MTDKTVTLERLRELFDYSPETGSLIRNARHNCFGRNAAGSVAGWVEKTARRVMVEIDGRYYFAHRLIWLHVTGAWPKNQIDHIDGNPSNNRWNNLRDVTEVVNHQNQRRAKSNNKIGFLGVTTRGKRYRAIIKVDGKRIHLGTYDTPEEAHQSYLEAKRKLHVGCTI